MGMYEKFTPVINRDDLTTAEYSFIENLVGLSYQTGDILYYNGTNLTVLHPGSNGMVLTLASGLPSWTASSGGGYTNLTEFVSQTPWRVFYSNSSGDVTELALGANGTFLRSNGASSAPTFATPAGSGDVTKVGTPANNQVGVWTGDGTIEGDAALTFDTTTDVLSSGGLLLSSLTASELVITDGSKNLVSAAVATYPSLTELTYVKGVTSAIQTQLNAKAPSTAPTFATSITGSYLTASEILITDGSKNIVSAAVATYPSLTELTYVKGVTSAIQTQLNTKITTSSTDTLTNKRIEPRIVSAASYTTDTGTSLDVSTTDLFIITAQAGALLFNAPGGTPVQGQKLMIRIKDNGTARALTYNAVFRASSDLALPTTTVLSKTLYMGFIYNSTDTKWDLLAVLNNF